MTTEAADTPQAGAPSAGTPRALELYRTICHIRCFEEHALELLQAGELPGVVHPAIGQEAIPAAVCAHLRDADFITSTHRGHGHAIAKGARPAAMMAELFGRATGACGGKGGSMHIADFSVGMLGANGIVAGGIPIAVGAAQGIVLKGEPHVVACFFGDGAVNRGPFLEGLNWAALFRLPVLFVCEDNGFAAFTRTEATTAGAGAAARAESLGVPAVVADGNDALALEALAGELLTQVRGGGGPRLIQARTYRLRGHTSADPAAYRPEEEVVRARERDPLTLLEAALRAQGVDGEALQTIQQAAQAEIARAVTEARAAPWPEPATALSDVQDVGAPPWRG